MDSSESLESGQSVLCNDSFGSIYAETLLNRSLSFLCPTPICSIARLTHQLCLFGIVLFVPLAARASSLAVTPVPTWMLTSPTASPSFRQSPAMTYDAATGQILLFGGIDGSGNYLNDTWTWNGLTWTQLSPANSPGAREMASMVYDPATGNVILFGGYGPVSGSGAVLGDTWLWDGSTWTQVSPGSSPAPREGASIDYDANSRAVLLFGGTDGSGDYFQDTWTWDGSNWSRQSPSNYPPARDLAGMAYDAVSGQTVLFGGANSGGTFNDTWTWDGANWTEQTPLAMPDSRVAPAMVYNAATGTVVLFGGQNENDTWVWNGSGWVLQAIPAPAVNTADTPVAAYNSGSQEIVLLQAANGGSNEGTWQMGPVQLGSVNVCPGGAAAPAPCSQNTTLVFNIAAGTTIGAVNVVTQGASGQDFVAASPDTSTTLCTVQTYATATTCTVDVTFAPQYAGLRTGAVTLADGSGYVQATAYLSGTGLAPQMTYAPGVQTTVASGLSEPQDAVVDGFGNIYASDYNNNRVVEVPWSGSGYGPQTTVGTGLAGPSGVAVDASGSVYIADFLNNRVVEAPWTGSGFGAQFTVADDVNNGLSGPSGVAVDANGNLYIADYNNNRVVEEPWVGTGYGTQSTVASGLNGPTAVAVDGSGNVFITDFFNDRVVEEPWTGSGFGAQTTLGSGLHHPGGVTVSGDGSVYIADSRNNRIVKEPWTGSAFGAQTTVLSGILNFPAGVAVDATGNVLITDTNNNQVVKLDLADAPSLIFSTPTLMNSVDTTDGAQTVALTNVGNQPLIFMNAPAYSGAPFPENATDADLCTIGASLSGETSCDVSVTFEPSAMGPLAGSVTLTDNNLNGTGANQSITLAGNGQAATVLNWTSPASITYGTPLGSAQLNATANVPGTFSYTPASGAVLTAGSQTLSVTFTPTDTADYTTATASVTLTVTQATPVITWHTPAPITYAVALSNGQLDARTGPAGTFVYTPARGTILGAGAQTLSVTFTPADTVDYTTATGSVTLIVNPRVPHITWPTPAPITYASPLGNGQLNASTGPEGTFVYTPAKGTILGVGTQTLSVTFTPTDTVDYTTATDSVTLTVNLRVPHIAWTTPAPITYAVPLGAAQLDASSAIPGTFVYTPAKGTILGAGPQTLSVTFTPTDTADYATTTDSVTLTVNQKVPHITWPAPAPITYGVPLGNGQLKANTDPAGTFVYTPAQGTILGAGTQTLSVAFTPTDTTDYTPATDSVTLTVNQRTPQIAWSKPAPIKQGTALSAVQLNASSGVAGTFTYTPGAGTVLAAGTYTLSVTLTPFDTADCVPATGTVTLTVNP